MKTENWKGPLVVVNEPEESVDDAEVGNSPSSKSECFVQLKKRHGSYHIPAAISRFSKIQGYTRQMQGKRPVRVDPLALANIRRRHFGSLASDMYTAL